MGTTTNFEKFRLLVWKNWVLQWNHKIQLIMEVFLPVVFSLLLVLVRGMVTAERAGILIYNEALPINTLDLFFSNHAAMTDNKPLSHLAYSPNSSAIFDKIVSEAATSLGLTYSGYANSYDLETGMITNNYLAGIVFDDNQANLNQYPKELDYRVRFPSGLRTSSSSYNIQTWMTNSLFYPADLVGPRNKNNPDGGIPPGYLREGFLPVQNAITMAFIKQSAPNYVDPLPSVVLQRYPYPAYIDDPLLSGLSLMLGLIIILSFIYPCTNTVRYITSEKEKQLKEVMKIMGLANWLHWSAWFVKVFVMMAISALLITLVVIIKWSDGVAVLTYSSFSAVFFFFLVYVFNSVFLCFMLATFFSKASTASAVTGLLWFITYLPYTFFQLNYESITLTAKMFASLLSNSAMGLGLQVIVSKEFEGEGLQWSNMFSRASIDDSLSMGHVLLMMLVSSFLYMLICLYMEQILPGDFGVPKVWYFPFTKDFWCGKIEYIDADLSRFGNARANEDAFEAEPMNKHVGVQVKNLNKIFGDKTVVDDLSLNMYEDEITVLLGHNGAGKTTTISILTGMFPPSSGTAIINGCDIRANIEGARMSLGICPQHNILFDDLTVKDHLIFYSRLKGLKGAELDAEVTKYIKKIELENKANIASSKLSGGMKRKLSVCAALCGGTKVVLCDEPSSGMDPAARRQLWDLLQSEKNGRTLLLTTHFMDEADVLGDRVAIMCAGKLECFGTSFFLKKKFGDGYRLICVKKDQCQSAQVTALLNKHIPGLQPHDDIGAELSYLLPDAHSSQFEAMLRDLEDNSDELYLNGYGIAITSLEEVFMKVGAEQHGTSITPKQITNGNSFGPADNEWTNNTPEIFSCNEPLLEGKSLWVSQWRSMFLKKFIYTIRNKLMFGIQNIMPILFIILTMIVAGAMIFAALNPLQITLLKYPASVSILEMDPTVVSGSLEAQIGQNYEAIINALPASHQFLTTGQTSFIDYILELGKTIQVRINSQYIAAATVKTGQITAWLNNKPLHSAPLTVNLIHNALAKAVIGPDVSITVTNDPLPFSHELKLHLLNSGQNVGTQISSNLCFCMCFISALYAMFLVKEHFSRAKLLQFVSGVKITTFWMSHFLCDMATFTITALVTVITLACYQEKGYATFGELMRVLFLIILFGVSVLPLTYLLSRTFTEPATGFARISIINIFCGNALFLVILVMGSDLFETNTTADILEKIFLIFPHFALAQGLSKLYVNSQLQSSCVGLEKPTASCSNLKPYFGWDDPGVLSEIIYLLITACVYFGLLIVLEYRFMDSMCAKMKKTTVRPPLPPEDGYYDEDVEEEKKRVLHMSLNELNSHNLVMDRMTKYYGRFVAVNQISVGVKHSECFGLLGVNGAGKTTTFKMLTGDVDISSGEAYVKGVSLKNDMDQVYKMIGYCPQFDALFDDFTGRETLRLYCLLRGVPEQRIGHVSTELAKSFGFMKHFNKQTHAYSGGNKRKLSTALAVLGGPSVVYLDEPTTGMDPAARRDLWNMMCKVRDSGKSIILTSHSMEECEALCTRLAIMVNGEFKCIGSTQHLKNKFTKGFILKMKMKKELELNSGNGSESKDMETAIQKVTDFVAMQFPEAFLQEQFQGILTFYVPVANVRWSSMFGLVESNMAYLNIEDYSISQTTLEEIFLQFAKYQKNDPRDATSK